MLDYNELLIDLKSAARLGSAEALDLALEGLMAWKAVAANARLDEAAVVKRLVPLGEVLAVPTVPRRYLLALAEHPLTAYRALAAVALTLRALAGEDGLTAPLSRLVGDKRPEVRLAVATALGKQGSAHFPASSALLRDWMRPERGPRALATALQAVVALAPTHPQELLALVEKLSPQQIAHPEILHPLTEALKRIATFSSEEGRRAVLSVLARWARREDAAVEIAVRALYAEWAREMPQVTLGFLETLGNSGSQPRLLRRTRAFIHKGFPTGDEE